MGLRAVAPCMTKIETEGSFHHSHHSQKQWLPETWSFLPIRAENRSKSLWREKNFSSGHQQELCLWPKPSLSLGKSSGKDPSVDPGSEESRKRLLSSTLGNVYIYHISSQCYKLPLSTKTVCLQMHTHPSADKCRRGVCSFTVQLLVWVDRAQQKLMSGLLSSLVMPYSPCTKFQG